MTRARLLKGVVGVLVIAALVATVASQWSDLADADVHVEPLWLVPAALLLLTFQALQGDAALMIMRRLGAPLPTGRGRAIFAAGLLARYVPSGVLAPVVRVKLASDIGVPKRLSAIGLVYEVAGAIASACLLCVLVITEVEPVVAAAVAAMAAGSVVAIAPPVFRRLAAVALQRAGYEAPGQILSTRDVVVLVGVFALSFVAAGFGVLCLARAVTPVALDDVPVAVGAFALGFVTSMVGFALPGGLGARELGLTGGLALIMPSPLALAVAVLSRLVQTGVELAYAGVVSLLDRRSPYVPPEGPREPAPEPPAPAAPAGDRR